MNKELTVGMPPGQLSTEFTEDSKQEVLKTYGKLPLSFEANQGQVNDNVKFLARGIGYTLFLTPTEAILTLHNPSTSLDEG